MFVRIQKCLREFEQEEQNKEASEELKGMLPGMIVEQIAAILLENVNIFLMGLISTAAIAGVGQINTVNNILMNLFQAFAIGGTVVTARYAGARDEKRAKMASSSALLLGLTVSLICTGILFVFRSEFVSLLFGKAAPDVIENSLRYFTVTVLTPPLWFLYFQCCGLMRSGGDTKRPMIVSVILNISGVALNVMLTLGFKMGVSGAAMAYLLSVGLAAVVGLFMVFRPSFLLRPALGTGKQFKKEAGAILGIALPSSGENLMFNGSRIVIQVFLAGMGTVMISANSVFNSVNGIFNIPAMTLYYLAVPVIGRAAGRGDAKSVKHALGYLARKTIVWSIPVAACHLFLAVPGSLLFTREPQVVRVASIMLMMYAVFALMQAGSFILPNGFKAVGDAKFAMVVSSATAWTIRVFGTWLLGVKLGMGAYAIVLTQGIDTAVRAAVYTVRFRRGTWLNTDTRDQRRSL